MKQVMWQNPALKSIEGGSGIHVDSYQSDVHLENGPTDKQTMGAAIRYNNVDGEAMGECASFCWMKRHGSLYMVSVSAQSYIVIFKSVNRLNERSLELVGSLRLNSQAETSFSSGYYFVDNLYRLICINGDDTISVVNIFDEECKVNLTITQSIQLELGTDRLYTLSPDKHGNIIFASSGGMVGAVIHYDTPESESEYTTVKYYDMNKNYTGESPELVANSMAIDEGESDSCNSSGIYIISTHALYRFGINRNNEIHVDWRVEYDRGSGQKPGQVSYGSGTTPIIFRAWDSGNSIYRRYAAICDNADNTMVMGNI